MIRQCSTKDCVSECKGRNRYCGPCIYDRAKLRKRKGVTEKICIFCKVLQPITEFYIRRENADGHHTSCRTCARANLNRRTQTKAQRDTSHPEFEKMHDTNIAISLVPRYSKSAQEANE